MYKVSFADHEVKRLLPRFFDKEVLKKLKIETMVTSNSVYTCTEITLHNGKSGIVGVGFSKCNPLDQYNPHTGIRIAVGRAMHNLQERIKIEDIKL